MDCYKSIIDNDFAEFTRLVEKFTTYINSADSQGYTLLEWVGYKLFLEKILKTT